MVNLTAKLFELQNTTDNPVRWNVSPLKLEIIMATTHGYGSGVHFLYTILDCIEGTTLGHKKPLKYFLNKFTFSSNEIRGPFKDVTECSNVGQPMGRDGRFMVYRVSAKSENILRARASDDMYKNLVYSDTNNELLESVEKIELAKPEPIRIEKKESYVNEHKEENTLDKDEKDMIRKIASMTGDSTSDIRNKFIRQGIKEFKLKMKEMLNI